MARACPFPTLEDSNAHIRSMRQNAPAGAAGLDRHGFATVFAIVFATSRQRLAWMLNHAGARPTWFEEPCQFFFQVAGGWRDQSMLSSANEDSP
jgi:hypothetical protein